MNTILKLSALCILCTGIDAPSAKAAEALPGQAGIIQCAVNEPRPEGARPDENIVCVFNSNDELPPISTGQSA